MMTAGRPGGSHMRHFLFSSSMPHVRPYVLQWLCCKKPATTNLADVGLILTVLFPFPLLSFLSAGAYATSFD
jgi:hypothetical protein